jgi:teichuronic acid biosynthesis glycosyltransferase TuaH
MAIDGGVIVSHSKTNASGFPSESADVIVYIPGSRWADVPGTDRRLATALGAKVPVLWVDPPFSMLTHRRAASDRLRAGVDTVAPGVTRLQVLGMPGASRPVLSTLAQLHHGRAIRSALRSWGATARATIVASPRERFPRNVPGVRLLYVTDDWVAGAGMMGLSARRVARQLQVNLASADRVAAVSPDLGAELGRLHRTPVEVLANGCDDVPQQVASATMPMPAAVLLGQLNERLDISLLEAVRDAGTPLVVVGPRTDRVAETGVALDRLLASDGVTWRGALPSAELPGELARMGVGLTPYADTPFNRASFPLKTLEYLASGLPVVSTDLPSVRWLNTDLIDIATGPADFAVKVREALEGPLNPLERERRIAFARTHSWQARAEQVLTLVDKTRQQ